MLMFWMRKTGSTLADFLVLPLLLGDNAIFFARCENFTTVFVQAYFCDIKVICTSAPLKQWLMVTGGTSVIDKFIGYGKYGQYSLDQQYGLTPAKFCGLIYGPRTYFYCGVIWHEKAVPNNVVQLICSDQTDTLLHEILQSHSLAFFTLQRKKMDYEATQSSCTLLSCSYYMNVSYIVSLV